ncbi:hypothetical protein ASD03_11730 [Ensifer sp. Root127]|nr:hypothetical protein ASD03_11730 [Ensifer sp. Root127]
MNGAENKEHRFLKLNLRALASAFCAILAVVFLMGVMARILQFVLAALLWAWRTIVIVLRLLRVGISRMASG